MKVVVTGASGLLGRAVYSMLCERGLEVTGVGFRRAQPPLLKCDLTDSSQIKQLFKSIQPDVVVHCAAERRPDEVDKNFDSAQLVNVGATENIVESCAAGKSHLIHLSTDYVFDGTSPPYGPTAIPNPVNKYGVLKLESEKKVQSGGLTDWTIIRVPVLFGKTSDLSESAVTVIFKQLLDSRTGEVVKINDLERRYPTYCEDVAEFIVGLLAVLESGEKDRVCGVLHFTGSTCLAKFGMAKLMVDLTGIDAKFSADSGAKSSVSRPFDCHLSTTMLSERNLDHKTTPLENALKTVLSPFLA